MQEEEGYDPGVRAAAFARVQEFGERIPIGILYRDESTPAYEEMVPALESGPLVKQPVRVGPLKQYDALKQQYL